MTQPQASFRFLFFLQGQQQLRACTTAASRTADHHHTAASVSLNDCDCFAWLESAARLAQDIPFRLTGLFHKQAFPVAFGCRAKTKQPRRQDLRVVEHQQVTGIQKCG